MRYIGSSTFPPSQIVEAQWAARDRRTARFVCEQPPYSLLTRGIEADVLPTCQRHKLAVIPWRKGSTPQSTRAARLPARYDLSLPANQKKLEVTEGLARLAEEAGMSLIHLAVAFVIRHPAVTSAIIGPRTMEQLESQLGAAEVQLSDDLLDRIDALVPPGQNVNVADSGWENPALTAKARRR